MSRSIPAVRSANGEDAEAVFALMMEFKQLSQSVSPVYDELRPEAPGILFARVRTAISEPGRLCLVASVDGEMCGFLIGGEKAYAPFYAIEKMGHVSDLFVREAYRGHGVGTALLAAAEAAFKQRGLEHMYLESIVHYPGNKAFYERRGYGVFIQEFRKKI